MTKAACEDVEHRPNDLSNVDALRFPCFLRKSSDNLIAVECRLHWLRTDQISNDVGNRSFVVFEETRDGGIDDSDGAQSWNPNVPRTGV